MLGLLLVGVAFLGALIYASTPRQLPGEGTCSACRVTDPPTDEAGLCCDFHGLAGAFREAWLEHLEFVPGDLDSAEAATYEYLVRCKHERFRHLRTGEAGSDAAAAARESRLYRVHWARPADEEVPHTGALGLAEEMGYSAEIGEKVARLAAKVGPRYYAGMIDRVSDWARASSNTLVTGHLMVVRVKSDSPSMTRETIFGDVGLTFLTTDRCQLSGALVARLSRGALDSERARRFWVQVVYVEDATTARRIHGMDGTPYPLIFEKPEAPLATGQEAMDILSVLIPYLETGVWHQPAEPLEYHPIPDSYCVGH